MTEQTQPSTIKVQQEQLTEVIRIQAYSLAEALQQAQTGVQQGYTIDLESNEGYPQQFGSMITFTLLKANVGAIQEVLEVSAEVKPVQGYTVGTGENAYIANLEVLKEPIGTNRKYTKKEK